MVEKPLMLKEHLELDSSSESFLRVPLKQAAGTTLRCLLDMELRRSGGSADDRCSSIHVRSHSKSALSRISNVIKAVNALQFFSAGSGNPANSLLHGSFSKMLRRRFWKRNGNEKERDLRPLSEETVGTCLFSSPSPVVSSCRSSFHGGNSTFSDFMLFSTASSPQKETLGRAGESSDRALADYHEPKENCGKAMDCPLEKEKEQFSPVSVMEFPYKDDDDNDEVEQSSATSPCSRQSLAGIETSHKSIFLSLAVSCSPSATGSWPLSSLFSIATKYQLGRFVSRAELHPVDLDHQFPCTETHFESTVHVACGDEEERRRRKAFSLLHQVPGWEPLPANEEKLLFEFFVEGLSVSGNCRFWRTGSTGEEEMMRVASDWLSSEAWVVEEGDDVVVGEMERNGEWRRFEEDTNMVVSEMSRGLMSWLTVELVLELTLAT